MLKKSCLAPGEIVSRFIIAVILYTLVGVGLLQNAPRGNLPLYNLATRGDAAGVADLLSKGVVPDTPGTHTAFGSVPGWLLKSETPLFKASEKGHTEAVDLLLKAGATADNGLTLGPFGSISTRTPLLRASEKGHKEVVDLLLKSGATADMGTTFTPLGSLVTATPLVAASKEGHTEVVDLLLKAGATPLSEDPPGA